ncbi:trans-aconitate 2-methyltransferase [Inquilinus limosus]|uniref:Trans-aconitate 2-methyltransferase n=1 Tax=Inquilinus limosus MP06 TaxID=1398085 RepID=A0A0A0D607_9PROT|nr:trans-aconitate 2-methyltransferase [Inquilinus limosus]KGM34116.1 trans-aconitate methyltransferase [Inquilinus limosus MP06]
MTKDWNPALYRRYEDERTRPARDLLGRVELDPPANGRPLVVYDLGCGPGNSTELLVERFPGARVTGIDSSEAMLADARARLPGCRFERHDVAEWRPEDAPDLIYANATLQWLPGHEALVPRLFGLLAPGGVLAVQMPDNREEPTHRLMRAVAGEGPWRETIGEAALVRTKILPLDAYYDLLAPLAAETDVWRTAYQHPMASPEAIVDWVRGTGLRPFIDPLGDEQRAGFLQDYTSRIAEAYRPKADGKLLLAFPRLFFVARRPR